MRTAELFAVLAAHVKTGNLANALAASSPAAEALHEFLKIAVDQGPELGHVLLVVRQRQKTVVLVEAGFVHASHGPLPRSLQAATYALATLQKQSAGNIPALCKYHFSVRPLIGLKRTKAGHRLEPDPASHHLAHVRALGAARLSSELPG